mmetsp:Transcript_6376/g.11303  ORF Transcript_6376/g.11303 Transcript_6376/m.11303 type:complete len:178 (+) Transcript_6376:1-534(+)
MKLGSLLALGFGEAGSEIVDHNMDEQGMHTGEAAINETKQKQKSKSFLSTEDGFCTPRKKLSFASAEELSPSPLRPTASSSAKLSIPRLKSTSPKLKSRPRTPAMARTPEVEQMLTERKAAAMERATSHAQAAAKARAERTSKGVASARHLLDSWGEDAVKVNEEQWLLRHRNRKHA